MVTKKADAVEVPKGKYKRPPSLISPTKEGNLNFPSKVIIKKNVKRKTPKNINPYFFIIIFHFGGFIFLVYLRIRLNILLLLYRRKYKATHHLSSPYLPADQALHHLK